MSYRILIGNEPYLINKYIKEQTHGYIIHSSDSFTSKEEMLVKQSTLFGNNAVVIEGNLSKEQEKELMKVIKDDIEVPGILYYVPAKEDTRKSIFKMKQSIIKIGKPDIEEVFNILISTCTMNSVKYTAENLQYLLDYSEYFQDDAISLYDLIGVIRSTSGNEITQEHIRNTVQRSAKDDAFGLIRLIGKNEELIEYMNRLSTNPYQLIGALTYGFRIMAKLKISSDIGVTPYIKNTYRPLSEEFEYKQIVQKLKELILLKEQHHSKDVAKSLILATLIE